MTMEYKADDHEYLIGLNLPAALVERIIAVHGSEGVHSFIQDAIVTALEQFKPSLKTHEKQP